MVCLSAARPAPTAGAALATGVVQQDQQELQEPPDVCLRTRYGFARLWSSLAQTLDFQTVHTVAISLSSAAQVLDSSKYDPYTSHMPEFVEVSNIVVVITAPSYQTCD